MAREKKTFSEKENLIHSIFNIPNKKRNKNILVFLSGKNYRDDMISKIAVLRPFKEDLYSLYVYNNFFKKQFYQFWLYFDTWKEFCWIIKSSVILDSIGVINEKSFSFLKKEAQYQKMSLILSLLQTKKEKSYITRFFNAIYWIRKKKELIEILKSFIKKYQDKEKNAMIVFEKVLKIVEENNYIQKNYSYITFVVLFILITWQEIHSIKYNDCVFQADHPIGLK